MALKFAVNNSLSAVTTLPTAIPTGALSLIQTQTASSSATISFTSGIDSTYDSYVFKFINIHPATDGATFQFNMSIDSGSNYNVAKTSTSILYYHFESGSASGLQYDTNRDLAQGTGFQTIGYGIGNDNDQSLSGELHLFEPSSTTFVKHFIATCNLYEDGNFTIQQFLGGYGNTTSAVDAIQFKMDSGNIDAGIIKLYGIK